MLDRLLELIEGLDPLLVYVVTGVFAAVENLFPPVPADVIALFGGFVAGAPESRADAWIVFLVVWGGNVAGALLVYWFGRHYGTRFFGTPVGRAILQPGQLSRLATFYGRHGAIVIFVSRFLPGFRAVVPVFAGTAGLSLPRTAVPLALASAGWYGLLVYLGATAGRNWEALRAQAEASGRWLLVPALLLAALLAWAWWRTRERGGGDEPG